MGKHGAEYVRVERDLYPTPSWVIGALAEHVELRGLTVWECACGDGRMAEALRFQGCARVYATDVEDRGAGQDEVLDFLSARVPQMERAPDLIVTNPPFGQGGRLATAFIEAALSRIRQHRGLLALLLPCDFDSAKTRAPHFGNSPDFVGKIVLRERVVWFQRNDGIREAPKENSAWFLWEHSPLRVRHPPVILYSAGHRAQAELLPARQVESWQEMWSRPFDYSKLDAAPGKS
jgi:predicted RNA methylase